MKVTGRETSVTDQEMPVTEWIINDSRSSGNTSTNRILKIANSIPTVEVCDAIEASL